MDEWVLTAHQQAFLADLRRLSAGEVWAQDLNAPPDGDFEGQASCRYRGAPMLAWIDKTVGCTVALTIGVFVEPGAVYAGEVHNQLFEWQDAGRVVPLTASGSAPELAASVHGWLAGLLRAP